MSRRPLLAVALISLIATVAGIVLGLAIDWFPEQASTAADDIDTLWDVLVIASVPVFVLVMAVVLYSVYAFRVRPGDMSDGAPIHGNTRLEVVWVTIPFIMVSAVALYGWVVLEDIEKEQDDPLIVNVRAQQFAWDFSYPEEGKVKSNQLLLPIGRPVEFRVNTEDVLHSFWVPEFRLKTDTVPGLETKIRLTPSKLGSYQVVCAELCGIGHSTMRQAVRVMPAGEFDTWLTDQQSEEADGGAAEAGGDATAAGKSLFTETGCTACHTLADAGSTAKIGPPLDGLAAIAAERGKEEGQTAEEYVQTAISDSSAFVVEGFDDGIMPAYKGKLSPAEVDSLVEYLLTVGATEKEAQ